MGRSLSVLRGGGWGTVVTKGWVGDELLVRKEGWEVVVLVNATD